VIAYYPINRSVGAIDREIRQKKNVLGNESKELQTVTKAIEQFLPEYTHLQVKRVPRPHILIDKKGVPFNLDQLSDGEKNLIALVGDIARRLAIANPKKNRPLEGEGIILIDEIALHLHPKWQRLVVPNLLKIFPNCQFFISTHSPQVISHVKSENVFLLEQGENGLNYTRADETYGMSLDRVVELVMDDESRPDEVRKDLDKLFEMIERKKLDEAKKMVSSLKKDMKTDPDIMRAETLIRREELKK
jgi:predicted ATP-binding protein involved in virulence